MLGFLGFLGLVRFGDQHHLLQEQMFDDVSSAMFTLLLGGQISLGETRTQRAQYPLHKEYTLSYRGRNIVI